MKIERISSLVGWPLAIFIARWILGLIFVMAGCYKIFERGVVPLTQRLFIDQYADTWIPTWLLWPLGLSIPFIELAAGIMLCLGLFGRYAAAAIGLLLIVTTYGHLLLEPLFDINGFTFTRLALALFVLVAPAGQDLLAIDRLALFRRRRADSGVHDRT
jgi:uncharacterized membrane protein YphA (DoxX/SURF4 family)